MTCWYVVTMDEPCARFATKRAAISWASDMVMEDRRTYHPERIESGFYEYKQSARSEGTRRRTFYIFSREGGLRHAFEEMIAVLDQEELEE